MVGVGVTTGAEDVGVGAFDVEEVGSMEELADVVSVVEVGPAVDVLDSVVEVEETGASVDVIWLLEVGMTMSEVTAVGMVLPIVNPLRWQERVRRRGVSRRLPGAG